MKDRTEYYKARRRAWKAAGLTSEGKVRVNQRHPELKGLKGREYHTQYMSKQRATDRAAWSNQNT